MADAKAVKTRKVKTWFMESANSRDLAAKLTQLSVEHEIFTVNPSANVGGSYEILFYSEK
jgi:hypothetical protein